MRVPAHITAYIEAHTRADGDCLLWTGAVNASGLPVGKLGPGGRTGSVRRWVYEQITGKRLGRSCAACSCEAKLCLAPDHLVNATRGELQRRTRGRSSPQKRRACVQNGRQLSSLTLADARVIRHRRQVLGETLTEIAGDYGVAIGTVSKICNGHRWIDHEGNPFAALARLSPAQPSRENQR